MKLIRDTSNTYLKDKVPDAVFDKFETYWLLENDTNSIPKINLKNSDVLISGTYKFENHQKLDAINEWCRSSIKKELKPKIIKKIDLISQDQRKVYYDFLKLEHKNIYDFPISFIT